MSCQPLNLVHNHVGSMNPELTLPQTQNLNLSPPRFQGAILATATFKSRSFSAVFVTLTCIKSVMSGVQCPLSIRAFLDMRSSAVSLRLAPQSPSSSPVTSLQSVAWSTRMVTVPTAGLVWSSSVRT
jgi:hypothetical protein